MVRHSCSEAVSPKSVQMLSACGITLFGTLGFALMSSSKQIYYFHYNLFQAIVKGKSCNF